MLRSAFFSGVDTKRLVLRTACIELFLRISKRDLLIFGAMHQQERATHFLHHAVELEWLERFERLIERIHAEYPCNVMPRHRQ